MRKVVSYILGYLANDVQEGLLNVEIALHTEFIVLKILLPVEGDGFGLDGTVLHINLYIQRVRQRVTSRALSYLIAHKHNGYIRRNTHHISMPIRHVLVCHSCCKIEEDNSSLSSNTEQKKGHN